MIDQMWSNKLNTAYQTWERAFYDWAMALGDRGMVNNVDWIRANGNPSSDPKIAQAYRAMQDANRAKEHALRLEYNTINQCPVKIR